MRPCAARHPCPLRGGAPAPAALCGCACSARSAGGRSLALARARAASAALPVRAGTGDGRRTARRWPLAAGGEAVAVSGSTPARADTAPTLRTRSEADDERAAGSLPRASLVAGGGRQ